MDGLLGDAALRELTGESALAGAAAFLGSMWLMRQVSRRISKSYRSLSAEEQLEWDGKAPSTLHAIIITAAAIFITFWTDTFAAKADGQPFVLRGSRASNAALGFSCGYFITDLFMLVLYYPIFGGPAMAVHHVFSLASVAASAAQQQGHAYTLALLATECTTPFVNARWLLDKAELRHRAIYVYNGLALLAVWTVGRIVLFWFFFRHVHDHKHEMEHISWVTFSLLIVVPILLLVLNLIWYYKILKGALKLLFKKSNSSAKKKD